MENFTQFSLNSDIYKAIDACGYTKPTPVQAESIPEIMKGKDVVVSAQTGTGKTAAFVLPALHNLSTQPPTKKTRVLILTPTRELASQITKAAALYGKFMRFNIVSLVGGMPYHNQYKDLARGADIIVATPGRLMDHMEQKRVDLSNVEMLVLDEADRMLDMGFIEDVQYIAKLTPASRQTLLFSATLDSKLMNAVRHLLKNPVRIDLSEKTLAAPQIKQEMYKANNAHHKTRLLKHFLSDENIYKAIIFSATKINADRLADQLSDEGFSVAALHGDLRQNVRNRTLEQLRRGKIQFLVATDVAARGIDISDISHVFNYDLPRSSEDYVHRIGRTGRAGKTGVAISFVLPTETRHLKAIERYMGQRINLIHDLEITNATAPNKNSPPADEILSMRKDYKSSSDRGDRPRRSSRSEDRERSPRYERDARNDDRPVRSGDRPDRGGDRPARSGDRPERGARFERDDRSEKSARPFRSDRRDRPERSGRFDRDDKPARSFKSSPYKTSFSDKGEHTERSDRPERSERGGDRPERSDRPARFSRPERSDRPARSGSDRPERSDRPARSDRPFKSNHSASGERGGRFERSDKPERQDRPFKSTRGEKTERGGRFERSDRPERQDRPFKSTRSSDRPERGGRFERSDKPRSDRADKGAQERKPSAGYQRRSMEGKPPAKRRSKA